MVAPVINMLGSNKHSGVSGIPTQLLVLHSGESPLRGGYAQALTEWANTPLEQGGPEASWHWFIDPIARVRMIDEQYAAWHASEANPMSEGFEQAGYARYSREEWLTPEGLKQLDNLAYTMAERARVNGIPARWLTTAEVEAVTKRGNRTIKGFCVHRQIDPETRTDPGDGYPYDRLLAAVEAYLGPAAAGDPINPNSSESEDTLTKAEVQEIKDHINLVAYGGTTWKGKKRYPLYDLGAHTQVLIADVPRRVWATTVRRATGPLTVLQDLVNGVTGVLGLQPAIAEIQKNTADDLAATIPDELAEQVVEALSRRLASAPAPAATEEAK